MGKRAILIPVVFFILGSVLLYSEPKAHGEASEPRRAAYVPGELLVKYRPSLSAAAALYYRTQWGVSSVRTFRTIGVHHVKLPKDMTVVQALEVFKSDPGVEYAEPNYYCYATATLPNDPLFANLWGLNNAGDNDIDAPEAWDITTGSSDVVIAVIDSGLDYNHPDLADNVWTNPGEIAGDGQDNDGNGYVDDVRGWDFVDNDNNPIDSNDHGTHVAGTIAAVGNNSAGITGVCWTAKIIPLRFLDAFGLGTVADAVSAIEYANDKGASVINNSWGSGSSSQALKDAIDASAAVVVCAAGNDGTNNDSTPSYPASYSSANIIAVAATDQNDELAWFSNYGIISVDVAAPGTNIYSAEPARQTVWSDDFEGAFTWTTGGTNNSWGLTSEASYSATHSLTDRPNADYLPDTDSYARTPLIDLSSHSGAVLTFWFKGTSQSGDYFYVQSSKDGTNWNNLTLVIGDEEGISWSGSQSSFALATADLGAYDASSPFYLRFNFHSNGDTDVAEGWFFDDVTVTAASSSYDGTEYQYMQGTSMAAPHVSGLAALIKAHNPSLNNTEIKAAIENSVVPKTSLSGLVATGGRVNAHNALTPPPAPSSLSATAASASQIDLSWTDNSLNESGLRIERKTGSGGTFSQIATVAPNLTGYSDTGVGASTTYYYRTRAYNWNGNSGYSNEASSITPPPPADSGGNGCFIEAAGYRSFVGFHFGLSVSLILVILLLGVAGFGAKVILRQSRHKRRS